jgi:hypothetical protein
VCGCSVPATQGLGAPVISRQAMGVQKYDKKRCTKKSCRKVLQKIGKKSNPIFGSFRVFLSVFGRFSVRGVQKRH